MKRINFLRKILRRTYDQKVIDYFENPPNVGSLNKNDPDVGTCNLISDCRLCFLRRFVEVLDQSKRRRKNRQSCFQGIWLWKRDRQFSLCNRAFKGNDN